MDPMADDLGSAMGRGLADSLNISEAPQPEVTEHSALQRAKQTILHREISWSVSRDESSLTVRADFYRFIHPVSGTINNTVELFVLPQSAKAGVARLLLLIGVPVIGALFGLLAWRLLQWDTNMASGPWIVLGALCGATLGIWLARRATQHLGVLLERGKSLASAAHRRSAEAAAADVMDAVIQTHRQRTKELGESAPAAQTPPVEPEALAEFTRHITTDPDAAVRHYGLYDARNRSAVAEAFQALEKDVELYGAYQEMMRPSEAVPSDPESP